MQKFIIPPNPKAAKSSCVYPWEQMEITMLCQRMYAIASKTGFTGTLEEFQQGFGAYLEANNIITHEDFEKYLGSYEVTALPEIEQILRTEKKVLLEDIIVKPIPYYEVSNEAGGLTVSIG